MIEIYERYVEERKNARIIKNENGFIEFAFQKDVHNESCCFINELYILPEARKKGCGAQLEDEVIYRAQERGIKRLYTSIDPRAQGSQDILEVLLKRGYKLYSAGMNVVYFKKEI